MRRREFITVLIGTAVSWPSAARAQQKATPVIGFLGSPSAAQWVPFVSSFQSGLKEIGYVEGENVTTEYRWADGQYDRLPALAAELVRRQVDVIFAAGSAAPVAAKAATASIPIVFAHGTDPIKLGLVASLNHPGGNVTGVNYLDADLAEKALGLIHELVSNVTVGATFVNPKNPNADAVTKNVQETARSLGLKLHIFNVSSAPEIDAAFASLAEQHIGMLSVAADPFLLGRRDKFVALAARYAVPAIYFARDAVAIGGLMSYGTNIRASKTNSCGCFWKAKNY
jgi:putative ABC transport system substrate-binding protein